MRRTKIKNSLIILAIDPASELGWALSTSTYGVWDLKTRKDESMGMKLLRLEAKLNEMFNITPFQVLVYERPGGQHKNPIIHQSKLIGKMEEWCELHGVEYKGYSSTEIKKYATGKGNAGKPMMIAAAQEKLGYKGNDDNEADALWLLMYAHDELTTDG